MAGVGVPARTDAAREKSRSISRLGDKLCMPRSVHIPRAVHNWTRGPRDVGRKRMASKNGKRKLRSQAWWDNSDHPEMTALYLERFLNYGLTPQELQSGRPMIGRPD